MARSRRRVQPGPAGPGSAPLVALFVGLAMIGVLARFIAAFTYGGLTAGVAIGAAVGGVAVALQAVVPAVVIARRPARPASTVTVAGLGLIGIASVGGSIAAAALAVAFRSGRTPSSAVYPIALFVEPAFLITAAVGAILVPIGLLRQAGTLPPRRFGPALVWFAISLWLVLAGAYVLQYVVGYTMSPPLLVGAVATASVAAAGWLATAAAAVARRAAGQRSLPPLAIGALLIGLAGIAEVAISQLIAADPVRARDTALAMVRTAISWVGFAGWWLVLVAAWRGLPTTVPEPGPSLRRATMGPP